MGVSASVRRRWTVPGTNGLPRYAPLHRARVVALFLRVQFNFSGDSLWFALLAKSVAHNGWAFLVPQLSAPYGLAAAAFPTMTNFDWLIMKGISLVSKDPAIVFNVFWLCTIFFTAWTGLLSLRLLGVPAGSPPSAACSTPHPLYMAAEHGPPQSRVLFRSALVRLRRVPGSRTRRPLERRHLSARGTACGVHPGIPVRLFQLVRDPAVCRRGAPRLRLSSAA